MRSVSRSSRNGCMIQKEQMKKPRAKQRDFKIGLKCLGHRDSSGNPCCLAGYFTWPQVALTHHVCHRCLYAPPAARVKQVRGRTDARGLSCTCRDYEIHNARCKHIVAVSRQLNSMPKGFDSNARDASSGERATMPRGTPKAFANCSPRLAQPWVG